MASQTISIRNTDGTSVDISADHPLPVSGSFTPSGTQTVTGPLTNAQLTAVTGTATTTTVVTDPAAATATELGLLRGILQELQAQTTLLNTIATNTAA